MRVIKTKYDATCPVCTGDGWIEVDYAHPQGHGEGYIRTEIETCDHCNGDGTIEIDDADLDDGQPTSYEEYQDLYGGDDPIESTELDEIDF